MSYITFSPNEIVYIKGVGYATLINCGDRNSISQKVDNPPEKKESIYFDPDLFNSDADSNKSKKSQAKSDDQKVQKKLVEVIAETTTEEEHPEVKVEPVERKIEENVNIVKARLQGSQVMVYTSQKNITKSIIVIVKSFLPTKREQIVVDVDVTKTVDTLRKMIFQQLGEQMNNYYNIKIYATSPTMSQLAIHSKTMINYQIKDNTKLILAADYAFTFRPLPNNILSKNRIALNNSNTLISTRVTEQAKKADEKTPIPLPPPEVEPKVEEKKETPVQEQKKEEPKSIEEQKPKMQKKESEVDESGPFHAKCSTEFDSGRRYWQIKIEKIPTEEDDILIGVCIESEQKDLIQCWDCDYIWAYQPLSGKKVSFERDAESNTLTEDSEPYGYVVRQNDTIGVLLTFKGRKAKITFYKNSISCEEAFSIELDSLKSQNKQFVPFVNLGGEGQVTLDSKATPPLDSYRLK